MDRTTLSTRIEKKLDVLTGIGKERCMYKVYEQLRDVNEKAYRPTLLAVGPYHHDKVRYGFMEEHQLRYQQQMLSRSKGSVETYITNLKELEERALKCYGEHISQTSDEFVEMILLDGCFIIQLFYKYEIYHETEDCQDDPIFQMKCVLPRIARDLLLLENQLPFIVLAKLFEMSESNNTLLHNSSEIDEQEDGNLGEHVVNIKEEKDGIINIESSTSRAQIFQTRLIDLALKFLNRFLPFKWNVDVASYNSTEKIKHLLCLAHEAHNPSLSEMVRQRLVVGFRFENAEFEHLLALIRASICISILDSKVDQARSESHEEGVKLRKAEVFKHLSGLICNGVIPLLAKMRNMRKAISHASVSQKSGLKVNVAESIEDWESIPFGSLLEEVAVEFNMAKRFKDDVNDNERWRTIPYAIQFQEAGIEFDKTKKFKRLRNRNRNHDQKSKPGEMDGSELKTVEKLKRLLCLDKIETWKSIPYSKELR